MNPLRTTLGSKLTERWLNLLVLPGALFLAATAVGTTLGHRHWLDVDRLHTALDDLAARPALEHPGTAALLVGLVLLAAAASSLAAQFLGSAIERHWLRHSRGPFTRALTARRRRRWTARDEKVDAAHRQTVAHTDPGAPDEAPHPDSPSARARARLRSRIERRDRIAARRPTHPTWYGDRMQTTADRVGDTYGVDLAALWPRLWLTLPEPAVRQLQSAGDSFGAAARLAAWAVAYALLACWWWPAALVAGGCAAVARSRARTALDALGVLIEAAVDVYGRELATRVGLLTPESKGRLAPETGDGMPHLFRKAE